MEGQPLKDADGGEVNDFVLAGRLPGVSYVIHGSDCYLLIESYCIRLQIHPFPVYPQDKNALQVQCIFQLMIDSMDCSLHGAVFPFFWPPARVPDIAFHKAFGVKPHILSQIQIGFSGMYSCPHVKLFSRLSPLKGQHHRKTPAHFIPIRPRAVLDGLGREQSCLRRSKCGRT